jgi:UrcA family protein
MRYALPALAALALGTAAAAAASNSVEVRYDDLDLSTAKGQKTLDRRIDQAARSVCDAEILDTGTRIMSKDATDCIGKAKTAVKRQVAALVAGAAQKGG